MRSPPSRGRRAAAWATSCTPVSPKNRARMSSGAVKTRWRIWTSEAVRWLRAERFTTRRARIASTAPSRVLALPEARPDCAALASLHAVVKEEPGQASAIGAGALDPDPQDRAKAAEPNEQPLVAGGGGSELLDAKE